MYTGEDSPTVHRRGLAYYTQERTHLQSIEDSPTIRRGLTYYTQKRTHLVYTGKHSPDVHRRGLACCTQLLSLFIRLLVHKPFHKVTIFYFLMVKKNQTVIRMHEVAKAEL